MFRRFRFQEVTQVKATAVFLRKQPSGRSLMPLRLRDHSKHPIFSHRMTVTENTVLASVCKESFFDFVKNFWHVIVTETPVFNWHVKYICHTMQREVERVIAGLACKENIVINVPPGSTKSTICSQMLPAWAWTRMPTMKFIHASYAREVAHKDSIKTRDVVESELYQACFPGINLRQDENRKGLFMNTKGGFRFSVGVNGAVTGYHGHLLIVDDPLNPEESFSEADLKKTNRWMETTLPSRKVDKVVSGIVLIQQRLHQADPSGEMVEKAKTGGTPVKHICLPAQIEEYVSPAYLKDFYVDGLLDPVRMPKHILDAERITLGEYGYASQYLQSPVPLGGGLFKTQQIKLEEHFSRYTRLVRSWDKAGTQDGGAYSCGVLMGWDDRKDIWILDVVRGQWSATERESIIKQTAQLDEKQAVGVSYNPNKPTPVEIIVEVEPGSGGKESGENTVMNLGGYIVHCYHPTGDKIARAYPLASQMGIKDHVHVLQADWTRAYIVELRYFPYGKYRDQVDASSGAYNYGSKPSIVVGGFGAMLSTAARAGRR